MRPGPRAPVVLVAAVAAAVACLAWATPAARPALVRVKMQAERPDYFLPTPPSSDLRFAIDASAAPPKARILLLTSLEAGAHQLQLQVTGAHPAQTFVVALPVRRGSSTFQISIDGPGRYDFGFWAEPVAPRNPEEYRFTVVGPVRNHRLAVEFPPDPRSR
jgi:hypothetical protein